MDLKIISGEETIRIENITLLITGQPGSGKTSMALTAEKPLLIGFDEFIYRPANRKDAVVVNSWKEIADLSKSNLSSYQTIIIDTVSKGLYFLSEYLIEINPKVCLNRYTNSLSLNGWGQLKREFSHWYNNIKYIQKKDLIFIAHEREERDGDLRIIRPDISGGTAGEILKMVDFCGYIFSPKKGFNVIEFNTTEQVIGKNPGLAMGREPVPIPNFAKVPDFLAQKIKLMKNTLNTMNERQSVSINKLTKLFDEVILLNTVTDLNAFYQKLTTSELNDTEKPQLWEKIKRRAKALGCDWHKIEKRFFEVPMASPASATEQDKESFDSVVSATVSLPQHCDFD